MSAPSRGAGASRARSTTPPTSHGRGSRGASRAYQPRGRGRGAAPTTTNPRAEGLLQGLQAGNLNKRGTDNGAVRGARGRGTAVRGASTSSRGLFNNSKSSNKPKSAPATSKGPAASTSNTDWIVQATSKFETLKRNRETERARAIKDGFLADPEKKTTLDNAITPVGTCTEMCPAFERVERIVQRMVDKSEKARDDATRPDEQRMVKRFRRSAAGYDEQLPSDIRTPATLKMTLDYLLDNIIGGEERLASVHKFVWDRTRGIRNDFSIQQVTKKEEVKIAVECLERIARFHILSLHQLSNPEHLVGEQFDAHQDREQLNNTLLSLMYYYDDNRHVLDFSNEAEFRAYCIIFELQSQHPDLEDRMQSWPKALLEDGRIKTAFKLYAAAGNNLFDQGPLRPMKPFSLAQGNTGSFWSILASKQVSYLMACVAEIYFSQVRFMALRALWVAATSAPASQRAKNQDWTLKELANVLGFDAEEQAAEFCEEFGLKISTKVDGTQYLDASINKALDKSSIPNKQLFSHGIVEAKRFKRTLTAVINGKTVPQAVREGLVVADEDQQQDQEEEEADDGESLFLPEKKPISANPFANASRQTSSNPFAKSSTPTLNPQAPSFALGTGMFQQPQTKPFGQAEPSANPFAKPPSAFMAPTQPGQDSVNPFANSTNAFPTTTQPKVDSPTTAAKTANPFSKSSSSFSFTPQSTPPKSTSQPFVFNTTTTVASVNTAIPATSTPSSFFTSQPITSQPISTPATSVQPPEFSSPRWQNIQNKEPGSTPAFFPATDKAISDNIFLPPGTVSSQQQAHTQPAPPPLVRPQQPVPAGLFNTQQHLNHARSDSPLKFSVTSNDPLAAIDQPATTWPRQFPRLSTPQLVPPSQTSPLSPAKKPGATQNPIVIDSVEADGAYTQNAAPPQPPSQPPAPLSTTQSTFRPLLPPPVCVTQDVAPPQRTFSPPPTTGYPWSDPTVPGYRNSNPPPAPPPKPPKPPMTAARKEQLVDSLAHVAMTQATGSLIDEYVKWVVPGLINQAVDQHIKDVNQRNKEIADMKYQIARKRYLVRKYGALAATNFRKNKSRSRAARRRLFYAEVDRQAEEAERRRSQTSTEAEEIQIALKESEDMKARVAANLQKQQKQKEIKERKKEAAANAAMATKSTQVAGRRRKSDATDKPEPDSEPRLDLAGRPYTPRHKRSRTETAESEAEKTTQIAGRKRKSDATDEPESDSEPRLDLAGRLYVPRHKRSRTETSIDKDDNSEIEYEPHKVRYKATPRPLGRSLFNSSHSSPYGTQLASAPPPRRTIDNTYTDYFRLKAEGIDPDTPFVALTAAQVEARRLQDEAEEAARAAEPMPWKGNSTLSKLINGSLSSSRKPALWGVNIPLVVKSKASVKPFPKPMQARKEPSPDPDSVDGLLRQLKSARQEQEGDTEWFKSQNAQITQEIESTERSVQVHKTIERRTSSGTNSTGLIRSPAGHDFVPVEAKPGHSLSRTEQRIRRTGARGLATAPIGGTPGYVKPMVGYLERTLRASLNGNGTQDEATNGTTADHQLRDTDDQSQIDRDNEESFVIPAKSAKSKGKERATDDSYDEDLFNLPPTRPSTMSTNFASNAYDVLNPDNDGVDRDRFSSSDPLQAEEPYSDDEIYEEEEYEEEEDLDEDEEDYDEDDDEEQAGPSSRGQFLQSPAPTQSRGASSGAFSGAGVSADDAIELDSD